MDKILSRIMNSDDWPSIQMPENLELLNPDMAEKWDEKYGDREIKLVFIGQHMDRHAIVDALDECLSD